MRRLQSYPGCKGKGKGKSKSKGKGKGKSKSKGKGKSKSKSKSKGKSKGKGKGKSKGKSNYPTLTNGRLGWGTRRTTRRSWVQVLASRYGAGVAMHMVRAFSNCSLE